MHTYQWNNRFVQTGGQAPDVFWLVIYTVLEFLVSLHSTGPDRSLFIHTSGIM